MYLFIFFSKQLDQPESPANVMKKSLSSFIGES